MGASYSAERGNAVAIVDHRAAMTFLQTDHNILMAYWNYRSLSVSEELLQPKGHLLILSVIQPGLIQRGYQALLHIRVGEHPFVPFRRQTGLSCNWSRIVIAPRTAWHPSVLNIVPLIATPAN